jgi:hypothetical protein
MSLLRTEASWLVSADTVLASLCAAEGLRLPPELSVSKNDKMGAASETRDRNPSQISRSLIANDAAEMAQDVAKKVVNGIVKLSTHALSRCCWN